MRFSCDDVKRKGNGNKIMTADEGCVGFSEKEKLMFVINYYYIQPRVSCSSVESRCRLN